MSSIKHYYRNNFQGSLQIHEIPKKSILLLILSVIVLISISGACASDGDDAITDESAISEDTQTIVEEDSEDNSANNSAADYSLKQRENYTGASASANVKVNKATTKMTAKAKTFKNTDKNKKYTITLKDKKGNAIKNAQVSLKVNGKTYFAKTNSKGKATFSLKKLTKTGKATITYKGDKYYTKLSKKATLTVKSVWKTISKGSKDNAMVKKIQRALKNNGHYLRYGTHYLW